MSMSDRKYATFFYGPKAEYAFDAYGQELMEEEFLDDFRDDDWYDGFEDYLEVCAEYLERAEAGDPVRGDYSSAGDGADRLIAQREYGHDRRNCYFRHKK